MVEEESWCDPCGAQAIKHHEHRHCDPWLHPYAAPMLHALRWQLTSLPSPPWPCGAPRGSCCTLAMASGVAGQRLVWSTWRCTTVHSCLATISVRSCARELPTRHPISQSCEEHLCRTSRCNCRAIFCPMRNSDLPGCHRAPMHLHPGKTVEAVLSVLLSLFACV